MACGRFVGRVGALALLLGVGSALGSGIAGATTEGGASKGTSTVQSAQEASDRNDIGTSPSHTPDKTEESSSDDGQTSEDGSRSVIDADNGLDATAEETVAGPELSAESDEDVDPPTPTENDGELAPAEPDHSGVDLSDSDQATKDHLQQDGTFTPAPVENSATGHSSSGDDAVSSPLLEAPGDVPNSSATAAAAAPSVVTALNVREAADAAAAPADAMVGVTVVRALSEVLGPEVTAQPRVPLLLGLLQWLGQQLQRTFFNATPQLQRQAASLILHRGESSDPIALTGTDADGDPLKYALANGGVGSSGGTLRLEGDKVVYTPSSTWRGITSYTETFTVTVTDQGPHIHGFPGLLHALTFGMLGSAGDSATNTVTISVVPADNPPQFTVSDPVIDRNDGSLTYTVSATDPDGDPVSVTVGQPQARTGTVTAVRDAGTDVWTIAYTPDPQVRVDAFSTPAVETDLFTVTVRSDEYTYTRAIVVTVDPAGAAVVTATAHTYPPRAGTAPLFGADGTVVMATGVGIPGPIEVTVIHPDGRSTVVPAIEGLAAGSVHIGDQGTVAVTTRTGMGSVDDPFITTVTIVDPNGQIRPAMVVEGTTGVFFATVGGDGTVYVTTTTADTDEYWDLDARYYSTLTMSHPDGRVTSPLGVDGTPIRFVVGDDGTRALLTGAGRYGNPDNPVRYILSVLRPDGQVISTHIAYAPNDQSLIVGVDGTVAMTSYDRSGAPRSLLTVVRADGNIQTIDLVGFANPQVTDDGTVIAMSNNGAFPPATVVTVVRPDGQTTTTTTDGMPVNVHATRDGHVYIVTRPISTSPADPIATLVTIVSPTGVQRTVLVGGASPVSGSAAATGTQLTEDGSLVVITGTVPFGPNDPFRQTVTVIDSAGQTTAFTAEGLLVDSRVAADGTVAFTTLVFGQGAPARSVLNIVRPGGINTALAVTGNLVNTQIASDGTVIRTSFTGFSSEEEPRTTITFVHPGGEVSILALDGRPVASYVASDGRLYVTTRGGDGVPLVDTVTAIVIARAASPLDPTSLGL